MTGQRKYEKKICYLVILRRYKVNFCENQVSVPFSGVSLNHAAGKNIPLHRRGGGGLARQIGCTKVSTAGTAGMPGATVMVVARGCTNTEQRIKLGFADVTSRAM